MGKIKVEELLVSSTNELEKLSKEMSVEDCVFCSKELVRHGDGFFIDRIIFKRNDKYYKFLAIEYLDQLTFTTPFRVFKEEIETTRVFYSNWIEEGSQESEDV